MNKLPNILIVDDILENLLYLEAIINKIKVNLIKAHSGFDAMEKSRGVELALAIIDVRMPNMNGYELATKMNSERIGDKVPVIFLTANFFSEVELIRGYNSGAVDYIFKPIDKKILLSKIHVFIDLYEQKRTIADNAMQLKKSADELSIVNSSLKQSEEKYRSYIDNAPDGVFISDETGKYYEVNAAACTISGYSKEELLHMSIHDLLPEDSRENSLDQFRKMNNSGILKADLMFKHKDGTKRWFTVAAIKLSNTRFLGFAKDITEHKQAEEALQESETNLAKAQRIAHIGSWEKDLETNMLKWSKEMFNVFDINTESFNGKIDPILKVIHPEDIIDFTKSMSFRDKGNTPSIEYRVIHKDGTVHYIFEEGSIEVDETGNPVKKIGTSQDITERKKIEEELRSSLTQLHQLGEYIEKVREEERVAISRELHDDLGQALTAVKIDLGTIRRNVTDDEVLLRVNKASVLVSETIKTVQRLTARLRPQIIDDLGLDAAIEWYTNEFILRTGIEVKLKIESDLDISPEASHIVFRIMQESLTNIVRHSKATHVSLGLNKSDEFINLTISDNGIGINEPEIKSKRSFGIISMKERAASLGGTFDIYNEKKGGAIISLKFPLNYKRGYENINL